MMNAIIEKIATAIDTALMPSGSTQFPGQMSNTGKPINRPAPRFQGLQKLCYDAAGKAGIPDLQMMGFRGDGSAEHDIGGTDFLATVLSKTGRSVLSAGEIKKLKEIATRTQTALADLNLSARTTEVYRARQDADDLLIGKPGFQGLRGDRPKLDALLTSEQRRKKANVRSIGNEASEIVCTAGKNIASLLEDALNERIEFEIKDAQFWKIPFMPSIVLSNLHASLNAARNELDEHRRSPGLISWQDSFSGTLRRLTETKS